MVSIGLIAENRNSNLTLEEVDRQAVCISQVCFTVNSQEDVDLFLGPELGCKLGSGDLHLLLLVELHRCLSVLRMNYKLY